MASLLTTVWLVRLVPAGVYDRDKEGAPKPGPITRWSRTRSGS